MRALFLALLPVAVACQRGEADRTLGQGSSRAAPASAACLDYRDTVELVGTLRRETHPGPPNYESIADGDEEETGFYLHLRTPICARSASPELEDASAAAQDSVARVQLVLDSAGYARLRPELGGAVSLRGTIFSSHTGHHHAPLLLDVQW